MGLLRWCGDRLTRSSDIAARSLQVKPHESHCVIPRLLDALKPGAYALLHLLWDTGPLPPGALPGAPDPVPLPQPPTGARPAGAVPKIDVVLITAHFPPSGASPAASVMVFQTLGACGTGNRNQIYSCVGAVLRRCPEPAAGGGWEDGCLAAPTATPSEEAAAAAVIPPPHKIKQGGAATRQQYHRDYLANLGRRLAEWQAKGHIDMDDAPGGSCVP